MGLLGRLLTASDASPSSSASEGHSAPCRLNSIPKCQEDCRSIADFCVQTRLSLAEDGEVSSSLQASPFAGCRNEVGPFVLLCMRFRTITMGSTSSLGFVFF